MRVARTGSIVLALLALGLAVSTGACELAVQLDRTNTDAGADAGCPICTPDDGGDDAEDDGSSPESGTDAAALSDAQPGDGG